MMNPDAEFPHALVDPHPSPHPAATTATTTSFLHKALLPDTFDRSFSRQKRDPGCFPKPSFHPLTLHHFFLILYVFSAIMCRSSFSFVPLYSPVLLRRSPPLRHTYYNNLSQTTILPSALYNLVAISLLMGLPNEENFSSYSVMIFP